MDDSTLEALEYPEILRYLSECARTPTGRESCLRIRPDTDRETIQTRLREVSEVRRLLDAGVSCPLSPFEDVRDILHRSAVEGAVLEAECFLDVLTFLQVSEESRAIGQGLDSRWPLLASLMEPLEPLDDLKRRIEKTIDRDGSIMDDADPELAQIRKRLQRQKKRVFDALTDLLNRPHLKEIWQDTDLRYRKDRYVVAVKSATRQAIPGIIHDVSQSKATCFVEPSETVDLNNELSLLSIREQDEIRRILKELSHLTRLTLPRLWKNLHILTNLDVIWAKGVLSRELDAVEPQLSSEGPVFREARHPLLIFRSKKQSAPPPRPIRLEFAGGVRTLVVSGANMGGKTAALKTLGLLALMAQSGMHVPASDPAHTAVFDQVFAVIGDEQDLVRDMSTFSSQMKRVQELFRVVTENSLVLLDEICTNTDPLEGSALALSILESLHRVGCRTLVTTHYSTLKGHAITRDHTLNVSVDLDEGTHAPLYTLSYGVPGASNAIEIARILGLNPDIIRGAESRLSPDDRRTIDLIQDLDKTHRDLRRETERVQRLRRDLEHAKAAYEGLSKELQAERQRILLEEREQAHRIFRRAEENLRAIMRRGRNPVRTDGIVRESPADTQKALKELKEKVIGRLSPPSVRPIRQASETLTPGCMVKILEADRTGVLKFLDAQTGEAQVAFDGVRVRTRADRLQWVQPAAQGPSVRHRVDVSAFPHPSKGVNLVGMTVEEALNCVDKTIDQAVLAGEAHIDLIHGRGTGKLREAIQAYLKDHSFVKGFHHKEPRQGGIGVTVVELTS